ncbi:hypothetical protein PENTCL1PPCAC_9255, partial [Pristionchus entomophagus]
STEASSLARTPSKRKSVRDRSEKKKAPPAASEEAANRPADPTVTCYDEAIKHLDAVANELSQISTHSIVGADDILKHGTAAKYLAEKLK